MARAVILTSYLEYPLDLKQIIEPDDYIVCLDGGYDIALAQGIRPQLLLGDFDSLKTPLPDPDEAGIEIRRYPPEKDYTDLELVFMTLEPSDFPELLIIGGLGGRLDQTMINIQMLAEYTGGSRGFRAIRMMDGRNLCFIVRGSGSEDLAFCRIPRVSDSYLSLIPLSPECTGVSLRGVKYPLESARLKQGASLSISNEFRSDAAELTIAGGTLLVTVCRGNENDF